MSLDDGSRRSILCLIVGSFEIKPNHKESFTKWGTPETTGILKLEYTAWLTPLWTPSQWFKLLWPLKMVSGFARSSWFPEFDFSCFRQTEIHCSWHDAEAEPQWCGILFSAYQFLYSSISGFTPNLREAFFSTTEYYKKDCRCIFNRRSCSDGAHRQWGQRTVGGTSASTYAAFIHGTKKSYDTNKQEPKGRISELQRQFHSSFLNCLNV